MTLPPDSTPPNGASPGQPSDGDALKAALRDVLGDLLPQFERHVLEQVDARIAERSKAADPSSLIPQVVESLRPMVTEQINGVAARFQVQIDQAAAHLQGAAQTTHPAPGVNGAQGNPPPPAGPPDKVDKVVSATGQIIAMLETALDSIAPKALNIYGQWQMTKGISIFRNPEAMDFAMQQDPVGTLYFAQKRVGPNPFDQVVPQTAMNFLMQGMKMGASAKGGLSWQPNSPGQPSPSAASSGVPSLPYPMLPGQTQPAGSGVSMSEMQQQPAQPNGSKLTTPVLRISPAPKGNAPGTGPANGTQPPRRKSLAEAMEGYGYARH